MSLPETNMEEQVNTLKEQIEKNKEEIQSQYTDLGIAYYRIHGNDETAEFQNICQEIASKYRAIEQMKQEILNLTLTEENAKICPECGSKNEKDSVFCGECGCKLPEENVCPNCGAQVDEGAKFCIYCGTKVE